jgi:hypothetical protein
MWNRRPSVSRDVAQIKESKFGAIYGAADTPFCFRRSGVAQTLRAYPSGAMSGRIEARSGHPCVT